MASDDLDRAVVNGDFNDFLKVIKSGAIDPSERQFNPILGVVRTDGAPIADNNLPKPGDYVTIKFASGVPNKWNYQDTMTWSAYMRWKLLAKEAGFGYS